MVTYRRMGVQVDQNGSKWIKRTKWNCATGLLSLTLCLNVNLIMSSNFPTLNLELKYEKHMMMMIKRAKQLNVISEHARISLKSLIQKLIVVSSCPYLSSQFTLHQKSEASCIIKFLFSKQFSFFPLLI